MTDRAKYWMRKLAAWESSGLTQAEFCRRRGLKPVTFAWWKRQLAGAAGRGGHGRGPRRRASAGQCRPAFAEVALPRPDATGKSIVPASGSAQEAMYEVGLPCGTSIRLPANFDVDRASQLIHAVTQRC